MAARSLLGRSIDALKNSMNDAINYVDVDYELRRPEDDPWTTATRATVVRDDRAVLNAYRMWLKSKRYDYARVPDFGGLFDNNLNDRVTFSPDNEETVRQIIMDETSQKWPAIALIDCQVQAIVSEKRWHVRIIAQDKNTRMVLADDGIYVAVEESDRMF